MKRNVWFTKLSLTFCVIAVAVWTQPVLAEDTVITRHQWPHKNCIRVPDWYYTVDVMDMFWEMHRDECQYYEEVTVTQTISTYEWYDISEPLDKVTTVTVCPAGNDLEACIAHVTMYHPDVEYRSYHYALDARGSDGKLRSEGGGWLPPCQSAKVVAHCGGDLVLRTPD